MADECWNDDIAYGFSIHRRVLEMIGIWPLQKKTVFVWIRWVMAMIAVFTMLIFVVKDVIDNNSNIDTNLENILVWTCVINTVTKVSCITYHQKELAINIKSAVHDWLSVKNDEGSRKIMKKYTFKIRMPTLILLYLVTIVIALYIISIILTNLRKIFFNPTDVDTNKTDWLFMFPSGELSNTVTGLEYVMILIIQITQTYVMAYTQCILDSFYFGIVLHLVGQLEVLKKEFKTFISQADTQANYQRRFTSLINRHSELMKLNKNLEDSFQIIMLVEFMIATITLVLMGLQIDWYLSENNYIDLMKSTLIGTYVSLQSLLYSFGGDFLQTESEDIFYTLYTISWFTLPAAFMKDLYFTMMRSSIPFRLSGGKFFYVNREAMMYVFKTAASYVSVIRVALRN